MTRLCNGGQNEGYYVCVSKVDQADYGEWLYDMIWLKYDRVSNQNVSVRETLSVSTGVRFDEPKPLLLMIPSDLWILMSRAVWNQGKSWKDYRSELIRRSIFFNIEQFENGFEAIESFVREGRKELEKLANL